jgi:(R)-2-hydroxyisocaproyl-CoA dehydratase beta subunit
MYSAFHSVTKNASDVVREHQRILDRPVIGVMPAYFPMELIDAAGGFPVQLWGNNLPIHHADSHLQGYCCSVAKSIMELELRGSADMVQAYAFTTLCDTLVNLREIYERVFSKPQVVLSMPMTRTMDARRSYLESGVESIVKGLEEITAQQITPTSLAESAALFGRTRELQRELYQRRRVSPGLIKNRDFYAVIKAGFFLPRTVYNAMLEDLLKKLKPLSPPKGKRPRIVISGLVFDPIDIFSTLDDLQVDVVDDDFANGWRTVSKKTLRTDNLVDGVAEYLYEAAPCCCLYNAENDRHDYLVDKTKQAHADGVLFWYINFCEPDAFDAPLLKERLKKEGIPVSSIDVELTMSHFDAVKTRLNAFSEILEG